MARSVRSSITVAFVCLISWRRRRRRWWQRQRICGKQASETKFEYFLFGLFASNAFDGIWSMCCCLSIHPYCSIGLYSHFHVNGYSDVYAAASMSACAWHQKRGRIAPEEYVSHKVNDLRKIVWLNSKLSNRRVRALSEVVDITLKPFFRKM